MHAAVSVIVCEYGEMSRLFFPVSLSGARFVRRVPKIAVSHAQVARILTTIQGQLAPKPQI